MYDKIVDKLNSIGQYAQLTGLERGKRLLSDMGNPERDLKVTWTRAIKNRR